MGRHARGVTRSRLPVATAVVGTMIVAVIAVGSWMGSQAQPVPVAGGFSTGSAAVVSSLACTDGADGTVVDVLDPVGRPAGTTVRGTLDGCGYQVGQQLAVQYSIQDPTQVSLAGTSSATDSGLEQSPIGIAIAGLLAIGVAIAIWIDSRRFRRPSGVVDQRSGGSSSSPSVAPLVGESGGEQSVGTVEKTPTVPGPAAGRHASNDEPDIGDTADGETAVDDTAFVDTPAVSTRTPEHPAGRPLPNADLVFPFASTLAASLRDELFTHRGVPT